ncbi:ATP-dependent helicase [Urinicoccus massiliensis]|uniref:ATP-dependent helicase n=1 Tax=Urinicoccus massiliensis TaxID=1723382 RepID=UPI0009309892|nr:ATP-dependent helicase [Urinicoccus massiliensis]
MNFTDAQLDAIHHTRGPALVLAVPGAGKTTVLMARLARLIQLGYPAEKLLTITFSKNASLDMKKRFRDLFPQLESPHFMTIHALCFQIIRQFHPQAKSIQVLADKDYKIRRDLLTRAYLKHNQITPSEEKRDQFFQELSRAKNLMIPFDSYVLDKECKTAHFHLIARDYEAAKAKANLIDFDDMLALALDLLSRDSIAKKVQGAFDLVQVDEAQDTSSLQMRIIEKIASKGEVFLVADDDQSIYGFRGAKPQDLLTFERDFGAKKYYLEDNFRSTDQIIHLAKTFIQANKSRYEKNMLGHKGQGLDVQLVDLAQPQDQYDFIKKQLKKNARAAVLYRNTVSSMGLVNAFSREDFSIRQKEARFFRHPILYDLLAFMDLAQNPKDHEALSLIYYKMRGYLSKKMVAQAGKSRGNVFVAMASTPGLQDFQKRTIYEIKEDFIHLSALSPWQQVRFILKDLEYDQYLMDLHKKSKTSLDQLYSVYKHFMEIAKACKNLADFKGRLAFLKDSILQAPEDGPLTFSTIHGVKGLEFDQVFILDLVNGEFPSLQSLEDPLVLEEERRLFYVAMTRAKKELYLLRPKRIFSMPTEKSLFLKEVGKILT